MERTKKEEKLILSYFIISIVFTIVLAIVFFLLIYPKIKEVEAIKRETTNLYMDVKRVEREGISYFEFKDMATKSPISTYMGEDGEENDYLLEIVNSIGDDFYQDNLVNNGQSATYESFLKTQTEELQEWSPVEKKNEIIEKILPVYSELISDLGEGTLSDFKFINYIESIAETFSLTFDNRVGVAEVALLNDYSVGSLDNSLETNIYYIPITLDLTGRINDIIDFLYFASHVGEVKIEGDDVIVSTDIDAEFRSTFRNKVLKGENYGDNIFYNQMFDVESVSFDNYIDPNVNTSDAYRENSLVNYLKTAKLEEDPEGYKITVDLRFFIKGLPVYRIESYIRKFMQDFYRVESDILETMSNTKINSVDRQRLSDMSNVVAQLGRSVIPQIERDSSSHDTVNNAFNLVNTYYSTLTDYQNILDQINISLGNIVK